jgi:hypothetical protein
MGSEVHMHNTGSGRASRSTALSPVKQAARLVTALATALSAVFFVTPQPVFAAAWNVGDVFLGVANGTYQVRDPTTGGLTDSVMTSAGWTTGCTFDSAGNLYGTYYNANQIFKFSAADPHTRTSFGTGGPGYSTPESIEFDKSGNAIVGNLGAGLQQYDSAGNYVKTIINTRVDWFDIAADQDTVLYTQEGNDIKRVSLSTGTPLSDFTTGTATHAFALRILPDGSVLLADLTEVKRYDAAGTVIQTYNAPGESSWFSLNLDPNGTSFWAGNYVSDTFYRFNIGTGAIERGPFTTNFGPLFGICVKGEITVGGPGPAATVALAPPTQTNAVGTIACVVATVNDAGGKPAPGTSVVFKASGANTAGGTVTTDQNGQATFCYGGAVGGVDAIQGCAGSNGSPPCGDATATWTELEQPISNAQGLPVTAVEGMQVCGPVATFEDGDSTAVAGDYAATIDWGDSTPLDTGGAVSGSNGKFTVTGCHAYAEEGTSKLTVAISDVDNSANTAAVTTTATVADAALTSQCAVPPTISETYAGPTATFTDTSSTGSPSDFTATIAWGDGFSSPGVITGGPGNAPYAVSGSHTYSQIGASDSNNNDDDHFMDNRHKHTSRLNRDGDDDNGSVLTITTTITDVGGSTTVASCTVRIADNPDEDDDSHHEGDSEHHGHSDHDRRSHPE